MALILWYYSSVSSGRAGITGLTSQRLCIIDLGPGRHPALASVLLCFLSTIYISLRTKGMWFGVTNTECDNKLGWL